MLHDAQCRSVKFNEVIWTLGGLTIHRGTRKATQIVTTLSGYQGHIRLCAVPYSDIITVASAIKEIALPHCTSCHCPAYIA